MTVRDIYRWIDAYAPFETQESYDNAGLLIGDFSDEVTGIHVALDATERVIDEAITAGANLIVTHHPLMFSPIRAIRSDDYESRLIMRMIRNHISLIAAHTNLDRAPEGISMTLARHCGLNAIEGDAFLRIGNLPDGMTAGLLPNWLEAKLGDKVRVMCQLSPEKPLHRMAVVSGAGSDFWQEALTAGADVFLTGEVKHHLALAAADAGMLLLEAGHFATEQPGIFAMADALQNALNEVKYQVTVSKSKVGGYAPPLG